MPRTPRKRPNELTTGWPSVGSSTPAGEAARLFAIGLRDAIGEQSVRALGRESGVAPGTIRGIIEGRTWPDLETIAKLETTLGAPLFPTSVPNGIRYRARSGSGAWSEPS